MKQIAFLAVFIFTVGFVSAQNSKVNSAMNYIKPQYFDLEKAKTAIDLATEHEKTKNKAKTWKVRGDVYMAIATATDDKSKKLCSNPLEQALEAYKKAQELDVKGTYEKELKIKYLQLGSLFINKGIEYFNTENYVSALKSFENSLYVSNVADPSVKDTVVIYNAAIAADRAEMYDVALKYYQQAADMDYEGVQTYKLMSDVAMKQGDTTQYLAYLKEGINKYEQKSEALMVQLINYYLTNDESDYALEYLNKAIAKDPKNQTFYFAKGALYDKLEVFDSAKVSYEKAVEIKPDYFDAYYNLGALYFNKGAEMLKEANNIPPNEQARYLAAVKESFKELEKALPYLEEAHKIDPTEKTTLITLKEIYFKLRNDKPEYMKRYNEVKAELDKLPE